MEKKKIKVSVIVPVYNAEKSLPICMQSLSGQTYRNMELLFIDDCSKDGSLCQIEEFSKDWQGEENISVKILRHEKNRGVAAARNTGLKNATGNYIYYVDADDRIEKDTIESLVKEAEEKDLDIVGINWNLGFQNNERRMNQADFSTPLDALKKMAGGIMRWNLWLFMVKRSLYEENGIRFTEGWDMGEDMTVMIKLFACAQKVSFLDLAFYHYARTSEQSLTKIYSEDHIRQVTENLKDAEKFLKRKKILGQSEEDFINFLKLNIKLPLLISDEEENYKRWKEWFPEANAFAAKNKMLPFRTRMLQEAAAKGFFPIVKLYYRVVIRFIYGVVFK